MKKNLNPSIIIATILLSYIVLIGTYLIWWNQSEGGLIQGWYHEYIRADGKLHGSGKWRILMHFREDGFAEDRSTGMDFHSFALFFGSWIYPFSVIALFLLGKNLSRNNEKKVQKFLIAGMLLAIIFLFAFLYLGVWTSVTSG